jgi:ribose transport system substrate-binding protein
MKKMRNFIFILAACMIAFGLTACTRPANAPETEESEIVIGLSLSTLNNPFFVTVKNGAEEAAERLDVTLIVKDAKDDPEMQNAQIEELIEQGVSALVINPVGGETVVPAIESANQAGIPVFTIDRSAEGGEIVSHITSNNRSGGEMAGEYLAEMISEEGKVVELVGIPDTSAAKDRGAGFNQAIENYPDITIVAQEVANFNREEGEEVFAEILSQNPDVDAVFAHNDEMILGAINAAKEAGVEDEIVFIGFDAIDDAITALEEGELTATIAQQPGEMGRLGVETAVKHLQGENVEDLILVDLALIAR